MKKLFIIIMVLLPIGLSAQVASSAGFTSGPGSTNAKTRLSELLNQYSSDNRYSLVEIGEDMFKAFCELENADSTSIALFKKIKSVKMLDKRRTSGEQEAIDNADPESIQVDPTFYNQVIENLDITGYTQLLKARSNRSLVLFLKKEFGPADNEFLLITDRNVIDIRGDIKIKTIYQMEEMMGYVQQILPN